jgi:hypothetical protein
MAHVFREIKIDKEASAELQTLRMYLVSYKI